MHARMTEGEIVRGIEPTAETHVEARKRSIDEQTPIHLLSLRESRLISASERTVQLYGRLDGVEALLYSRISFRLLRRRGLGAVSVHHIIADKHLRDSRLETVPRMVETGMGEPSAAGVAPAPVAPEAVARRRIVIVDAGVEGAVVGHHQAGVDIR